MTALLCLQHIFYICRHMFQHVICFGKELQLLPATHVHKAIVYHQNLLVFTRYVESVLFKQCQFSKKNMMPFCIYRSQHTQTYTREKTCGVLIESVLSNWSQTTV